MFEKRMAVASIAEWNDVNSLYLGHRFGSSKHIQTGSSCLGTVIHLPSIHQVPTMSMSLLWGWEMV